jgi:hypothetical protein
MDTIQMKCFETVFIFISHPTLQWINDPRLIKFQDALEVINNMH